MSKFNKTKEPVVPTTINEMGERAYKLSYKEELVSTILTTFLDSSYYEKETDIVSRILTAADNCDAIFVAKAAIYARKEANMRSVSHLLAGYLGKRLGGSTFGSSFYNKVTQRPDDISEILAYIKHRDGKLRVSNAMKRGFRAYLSHLRPYVIDKYKMKNKDISLIDLVNLLHPKPTSLNEEAYKRLMSGKSLKGLYTGNTLEHNMSEAGSDAKAKEDAISMTIEAGMPIMNLIRNLRNIIQHDAKDIPLAIEMLTSKDKILNSKQLPFRFLSAYREVEKLTHERIGVVRFEKGSGNAQDISKVLAALEQAILYSIENIPKLAGNTAILTDHSGSMRGDSGGASLVSRMSSVTTATIGDVFSSMMTYSQDNVYVGLFGDRLINVPVDRKVGPLAFSNIISKEGSNCGGATENGLYIFLNDCIKNKVRVDNLIIFSDMVIGSGGEGGWDRSSHAGLGTFQSLFKKFKGVNPQCNTICVNLRDTGGKSVFNKSLNVTQVSGWSDKIFDVIGSACKGYDELIKIIEAIRI